MYVWYVIYAVQVLRQICSTTTTTTTPSSSSRFSQTKTSGSDAAGAEVYTDRLPCRRPLYTSPIQHSLIHSTHSTLEFLHVVLRPTSKKHATDVYLSGTMPSCFDPTIILIPCCNEQITMLYHSLSLSLSLSHPLSLSLSLSLSLLLTDRHGSPSHRPGCLKRPHRGRYTYTLLQLCHFPLQKDKNQNDAPEVCLL